ncbi:hypothetical protein [Saccharomonospora saliphila]|uniref:hypothetical protein n=1 Tax=Saccharomonospora saliphila TaxID=369829 RepID=UPI00037D0544|nr:hypothetical protein [Saccharomonospora saliphila]
MGPVQADHDDGREALVRRAQRALAAASLGEDDEALSALGPSAQRERRERTRELMLLLFGACSAMVAGLGDGGATPVRVQVFDESGEEVSIDQAAPPVRTAVRTLLAEVHGNPEAAVEQVEIALASAARDEVDSLLVQALRWTVRLAVECLDRDVDVPAWITEALTG